MTIVIYGVASNFSKITFSDQNKYFWNVFCNDTLNNRAFSSNNNTFFIDQQNPSLTITAPTGTVTSRTNIPATWSASDYTLNDTCTYNVYRGTNVEIANTTTTCSTGSTTFTVTLDANFNFTMYAFDNAGNVNTTYSAFTVDTTVAPVTPSTGGGGGGSISTKKVCKLSIKPEITNLDSISSLKEIVVSNEEDSSYEPTISIIS